MSRLDFLDGSVFEGGLHGRQLVHHGRCALTLLAEGRRCLAGPLLEGPFETPPVRKAQLISQLLDVLAGSLQGSGCPQ